MKPLILFSLFCLFTKFPLIAMGNVKITVYADSDRDGFPDQSNSKSVKPNQIPVGYIVQRPDGKWDCDDTKASVNPSSAEICNSIDDNCNGQIDENVTSIFYADNDRDGYGNPLSIVKACDAPSGYVLNNSDCDDNNALVNPVASEICNNIDDNCNGVIDENLIFMTRWKDSDGDGYGNVNIPITTCQEMTGYVSNSGDCNDNDPSVHSTNSFYVDADGDTFGSTLVFLCSITAPTGYSTIGGDCNDNDPSVHTLMPFFVDADMDGYGTSEVAMICASAASGYSKKSGDCNDNNAAVYPDRDEIFNGIDDNCDGQVDEGWVNPYVNGFCDELVQWDRGHTDISMYSEPFNTNYSGWHSKFGTFTNGIASVHFISNGGIKGGFNFPSYPQCRPYPGNTQTCTNTPISDCSGDGIGCYLHAFDFYPQLCQYYAEHGIAMIVNINPYIKDWAEQKKYIDIPLSYGVNVIGVIFGTELAVPSWYANSYYYPKGGADYSVEFLKLKDNVHATYNLPVGIWTGDIWDVRGFAFDWCNAIASAAQQADFIAAYGKTENIVNRNTSITAWTEAQAADSVLTFATWLDKWEQKLNAKYGTKKVALLTNGTDPTEKQVGATFMGDLQTEYQIMSEQMSAGIKAAQEYRTRGYKLNGGGAASSSDVMIRNRRGAMYNAAARKEWLNTGNDHVVGIKFTKEDGHGYIEVLNFTAQDWKPSFPVLSLEGWNNTNLMNASNTETYYSGGNNCKTRSISFLTF